MSFVRVADYIMNKLYEESVKNVFTVTGRGALFLTDALAKHDHLSAVCLHHEQSCAFASASNSFLNNDLSACLVSTGCASTNTVTGLLSSWQDGLPVIFISGQNTLKETTRHTGLKIRTYGQQEADIISIVEPITKYSVMLTNPEKVVYEFEKAIYLAKHGRKGPVWIDVPLDVQSLRIDPENQMKFEIPQNDISNLNSKDLNYIIRSLNNSKRPVFMIGSGVYHSKSEEDLKKLIEKTSIPLVYTASSTDLYGSKNKYSIGSVGSMGCSRAGSFALQNSDLIIVFGSRLNSITTGTDFCKFGRSAKIIVIDIDNVEHTKEGVSINRLIIADVNEVIKKLLEKEINLSIKEWGDKCIHWKELFSDKKFFPETSDKIDLYQISDSLSKFLPSNGIFITDSGFAEVILPTNIDFGENQSCVHPYSQGTMGYALPAVLGAYFHDKDRPIYVVVGDGSVMMNIQELQSIKYYNIPVKIIIINNNVYSIIRRRQVELFRKRTIGTDPSNGVSCPDFKNIAECFDFDYMKIESSETLNSGIEELNKAKGPIICEIFGREDQEYIEISHTRNVHKKIVKRPLEDQYPFIERDLFLNEMIIEPIDQ